MFPPAQVSNSLMNINKVIKVGEAGNILCANYVAKFLSLKYYYFSSFCTLRIKFILYVSLATKYTI